MELLLGLLVILIIALFGYITHITLKYYKEMQKNENYIDSLRLDNEKMTKLWLESDEKLKNKCLVIDILNADIIELKKPKEVTTESAFAEFKKLTESDPDAKRRLEQIQKVIYYSPELEEKE